MNLDPRPYLLTIALSAVLTILTALGASTLRIPLGVPCALAWLLGLVAGYHARSLAAILRELRRRRQR